MEYRIRLFMGLVQANLAFTRHACAVELSHGRNTHLF
jgi:hypothetical protein